MILLVSVLSSQARVSAGSLPGSMSVSTSKSTYTTSESIIIKWTVASGATKYGLSVWKPPYGSDKYLVFDNYVTGTYKDIGKLPAGSYKAIMKPYNNAGSGTNSNTLYFEVTKSVASNQKDKFDAKALETFLQKTYPYSQNFKVNGVVHSCSFTKDGFSYYTNEGVSSTGLDGHGYGCRQCVSFAAWRMNDITKKYLNNLGNPSNWYSNAGTKNKKSVNGLQVIEKPIVGAIAVWEKHVAVVENVTNDKVIVSEGNFGSDHQIKIEGKKDIDRRQEVGKFKGYVYVIK